MAYSGAMDFPSCSILTSKNVTTAGTTIVVASSSTSAIYVTGLIISNGATAGFAYFGYGADATAPTGTAIMLDKTYIPTMGTVNFIQCPIVTPVLFKVPAGKCLLMTALTCTTLTINAFYYLAG